MPRPSQSEKLYALLKDGEPHRVDEIMRIVYGDDHLGIARISARIWDVRQKYGVTIKGWPDPIKKTLYWYQLMKDPQPVKLEI